MEIIKILIISLSSLATLTRFILVGLLFDLFYQNFDKIYQLVSCNQLKDINNRTYKHGFSTKSRYDSYLGTPSEVPNEMVLPDPFTDVFRIHLCGEMLGL